MNGSVTMQKKPPKIEVLVFFVLLCNPLLLLLNLIKSPKRHQILTGHLLMSYHPYEIGSCFS